MQGYNLEDIATGIDEIMIRQPVGVCAAIAPFNFPGMITSWFMPYAIACGNTYIVKPSEKVPLTMQKIFQLIESAGLPKGVVNLVNGSEATVNAILDNLPLRRSALSVRLPPLDMFTAGQQPTENALNAKAERRTRLSSYRMRIQR